MTNSSMCLIIIRRYKYLNAQLLTLPSVVPISTFSSPYTPPDSIINMSQTSDSRNSRKVTFAKTRSVRLAIGSIFNLLIWFL